MHRQVNKVEAETSEGSHCERNWMVVDDNPGILQVVSTMARLITCAETRTFSDGASALNAFRQNPGEFEFVITDLEMPGMNGLELCNALRELAPRIKVILMTGNHAAIDEPTARLLGFAGLIYKPFSPTHLLRCCADAGALQALPTENEFILEPTNR